MVAIGEKCRKVNGFCARKQLGKNGLEYPLRMFVARVIARSCGVRQFALSVFQCAVFSGRIWQKRPTKGSRADCGLARVCRELRQLDCAP